MTDSRPRSTAPRVSVPLRAFSESGSSTEALSFSDQSVPMLTLATGAVAQTSVDTSLGALVPRATLEFRHDFAHTGTARMRYADETDGPDYETSPGGFDRDTVTASLGTRLHLTTLWSLGLSYGFNRSNVSQWSRIDAIVGRTF